MSVAPEPFPPDRWLWRVFGSTACPRFERTMESLSIHEASHAVAALVCGFPHVLCTITANGGRATPGGLYAGPEDARPAPDMAQSAATILATIAAAGLQGELLGEGLRPSGVIWINDSDGLLARGQLKAAFGSSTPEGYCQIVARSLLSQNWRLVERIAAALIEHGALRAQIAEPGAMAPPGYSEIWNAHADGSSPRRVGCLVTMETCRAPVEGNRS